MTDLKGGLAQDITRVATGAGIVFSGTVFWAAASFLFGLFAARVLGPADFGLYSLGLAVFNVLSILSLCGMDNGLVRFVALFRGENDQPRVKGAILFALFTVTSVGLGIGLLLFLLSGTISNHVFHKEGLTIVLRWFALGLPLFGAVSMFWAALQGFQNMKYLAGTRNILEPAIRLLAVSLFFLAGFRLTAVVWSHLLAWMFSLGGAAYLVIRIFPRLKKPGRPMIEARRIVSFSLPLLLVGFLNIGINRTDRLLLGYFRDSREVGLYSAAFQTAMLLMMILQSFNTVFAPMISDLFNRAERTKLALLFQAVTRWVLTAALPLFVVFALFPEDILALFGDPFRLGSRSLVILAAAQLVNCLTGPVGYMLIMSGHPRMEFLNNLVIFVLEFILALVLIPRLGIEGAAVAAAVSLSLVNGLRLLEVSLILKMHPYSVRFLKPIGAGFILFAALAALKEIWPATPHLGLSMLPAIGLSLGLYALALVKLGLSPEDNFILLQVKRRLGGKVEDVKP
jgi:O-antigen/teichoic acid export membrane protein